MRFSQPEGRAMTAILLLVAGVALLAIGVISLLADGHGEAERTSAVTAPATQAAAAAVVRPDDSPAGRVTAFLEEYDAASAAERSQLLPRAVELLAAYGKHWQGSSRKQLAHEFAHKDLAERIAADFPEAPEAEAAHEVARLADLRARMLSDSGYLERRAEEVRTLLSDGQHEECAALCSDLIAACHGCLPGVELALGSCQMAAGDGAAAVESFQGVVELSHETAPQKAATAAYLTGEVLLRRGSYDEALKQFRAVQVGYPSTTVAGKAAEIADRLSVRLHATDEGST